MGNINASARYAIVESVDDGTSGPTNTIHFFADAEKARVKFNELLENYREYFPDFDALINDPSQIPAFNADGGEFGYDDAAMEFNYYNGDDDYLRVYLTRVQANTSVDIHY